MQPNSQSVTKTKLTFTSGGLKCAADLYLPANATGKPPCVVMGHGFSGTKDFAMPAFAQGFAENGMAALAFDYRHFGESEGEPRQIMEVKKQREDFHAAIALARSLDQVDPERIALWGSSLGGGHVIAVTAEDQKIAASIAQVPAIDMYKGGGTEKSPAGVQLRMLWAALDDTLVRSVFKLKPHYVPVVAEPNGYGSMTEPGAVEVTEVLKKEGASTWRNEFAPRFAFGMPKYIEGTIEKIKNPILFCLAEQDVLASPEFATNLAKKAPKGEVITYPVGHFGLYTGEGRQKAIVDQMAFLKRNLGLV